MIPIGQINKLILGITDDEFIDHCDEDATSFLDCDRDDDNSASVFEVDIMGSGSLTSTYDMSVYDTETLSKTPLYDGSNCTLMDAVVKYLHWFSDHPGISKETLSNMLSLQYDILPPGNNLLSSYDDAIKMVELLLIQPIIFHACKNDCIIYRKDYAQLSTCPKCGEPRYTKPGVAVKHFIYLPTGPRLVHLFGTSNLSQIVQAHGMHVTGSTMYDVHDSPVWKLAYSNSGQFSSDCRGIFLTQMG